MKNVILGFYSHTVYSVIFFLNNKYVDQWSEYIKNIKKDTYKNVLFT